MNGFNKLNKFNLIKQIYELVTTPLDMGSGGNALQHLFQEQP